MHLVLFVEIKTDREDMKPDNPDSFVDCARDTRCSELPR